MLCGLESRPHRYDTVLRYAVTLQVCTHRNGDNKNGGKTMTCDKRT